MRFQASLALSTLLLFSPALGSAAAQEGPPVAAPKQAPVADARAADRAAVRKALDSFAKTFAARDAKTLAAHFTAEGEFQNVQGTTLRGRETMERAFAEFFAKTPEVKAEVQPESMRFLSADSAIDEGLVIVQRGAAEPATQARYTALVVREDGAWRLAMLKESPIAEGPSIADLGWLIGQWKSVSGEGAEIQTTYAWDAGQKFIHARFTVKEAGLGMTLSGTQVIGLDPATGLVHSWTFEDNGGIGEADWHRDGDHWVLDAAGTLADGRTIMLTNVLRRVNHDTITWQSVNRTLGDIELADLAPIKVTRMKSP